MTSISTPTEQESDIATFMNFWLKLVIKKKLGIVVSSCVIFYIILAAESISEC
jgi:hypothetical protein